MEKSYEVPRLDASPGVLSYHALRLDAEGGVAETVTVEARSDEEAVAIVGAWPNVHGIDLWERGRLIASYPPRSEGEVGQAGAMRESVSACPEG